MNKVPFIAILCSTLICGCEKERAPIPPGSGGYDATKKVEIKKINNQWELLINGKIEYIKGAATNDYHERVTSYGGNALRTYSVDANTPTILNKAKSTGAHVVMGLWVNRERDGFNYDDEAAVAAQLEKLRAQVRQYKNHPAIIMWAVGNEAESSYKNPKLWNAINDIAAMIHQEDTNHPTTTVLASSNVEHIRNIITRAPHIDILSINTYAPNLPGLLANIQTAEWTKPYMVTEYGPRGTWQMAPEPSRILPWGALVEQTSTEKALDYRTAYQNSIAANRKNGCIGSFVFVWGFQRHGEVLNWYGLFDKNGYSFGAVDEMQFVWTGVYPTNKAPYINNRNDILMNEKKAEEAIVVSPSSVNNASVVAGDPEKDPLRYRWVIMKEGTTAADGSFPEGVKGLFSTDNTPNVTFKAPDKVGEYRLYVFVYDDAHKKVASAVIPFKVE